MTEVCNPVSVFSDRYLKLLRNMTNQRGEEVNVLDEYIGVLHPDYPCALELSIFQIEVEFTATFILPLVCPVDGLASLAIERNRNDGSLGERLGFQAVNDICNLLSHTVAIISLSPSTLRKLPLVILLVRIIPPHVLLGVVVQCIGRKQLGLHQRRFGRNILDDTNKVAHDKLTALQTTVSDDT